MSVHLVPGPTVVVARRDDGVRWCFGCRARLAHSWECLIDPPERQPSYYDPLWVRRCSRCGQDRTAFPGTDGWGGPW